MSQFVVAVRAGDSDEASGGPWQAAHDGFARAVRAFGRPLDDPADQRLLADAATQLGHARIWEKLPSRAADSYALAIGWAPDAFDYGTLHRLLYPERTDGAAPGAHFLRALEEGARRFTETFGDESPRAAELLWWLGWARWDSGRPAEAEAALLASIERNPAFLNAWLYVALARADAGEPARAVGALRTVWEADPMVLLSEVRLDLVGNVARLARLLDVVYGQGDLVGSALVAEICAEASEVDPTHWNNLGLFLRDEADRLDAEGRTPADARQLETLHERSHAAYRRALELAPDDPRLLNDTAVLLHYYLGRDRARALRMYGRARELAEERLASEPASGALLHAYAAARDDATINERLLVDLLAQQIRLGHGR